MNAPSSENDVAAATQTLALLNQQADAVRADLLKLRGELAKVQHAITSTSHSQLLEANEQLVLAAMRAQDIADKARRNLKPLARSGDTAAVQDLRDANEQLVIAALKAQEKGASAEEAHRRQIKFLAMAAHELSNPLQPLRLAADMVPRVRTEEKLLALQATIVRQVGNMTRLIGDLLDGSRVSTGKIRLERSMIPLSDVLEQTIEACQPTMDARRHRFQYALPPAALNVHGDALRLAQVFGNLLENAAKYTPEAGEISLEGVVREKTVEISVCDNGIGITAEALPHVFELFVQDPHGKALSQGGLGIGLAVVRELAEAHGGAVVAGSPGKGLGSKFVVTLPLASAG